MGSIDFQLFRIKHLGWKTKLRDFLDGKGGLTEEQAVSHKDCSLGKWLYPAGLAQYSGLSEMRTLEKVHVTLHDTARKIISLKNSGNAPRAAEEYKKIGPISDEIIDLLKKLEVKVKRRKKGEEFFDRSCTAIGSWRLIGHVPGLSGIAAAHVLVRLFRLPFQLLVFAEGDGKRG